MPVPPYPNLNQNQGHRVQLSNQNHSHYQNQNLNYTDSDFSTVLTYYNLRSWRGYLLSCLLIWLNITVLYPVSLLPQRTHLPCLRSYWRSAGDVDRARLFVWKGKHRGEEGRREEDRGGSVIILMVLMVDMSIVSSLLEWW